jgi:hypothetical protein
MRPLTPGLRLRYRISVRVGRGRSQYGCTGMILAIGRPGLLRGGDIVEQGEERILRGGL